MMIDWLAKKICIHKYGKVEEGYQYCEYCGLARCVRVKSSGGCEHRWTEKTNSTIKYVDKKTGETSEKGFLHILRCEKCGDLKEFRSEV